MLKNYFISAIRSMRRQELTSLINITGLSLGITCAIVIFLLVQFANSYNDFFDHQDRLFRVVTDVQNSQGSGGTPGVPPPMPESMKQDINGIETQAFISASHGGETLIRKEKADGEFEYFQLDENVAYTEPSFFKLFTPDIIAGSSEKFGLPKKVIISEEVASQWFPDSDGVGEVIQLNREDGFEVIAIMETPPDNSDIPFELLISYSTIKDSYLEDTGWESVSSDDQVYLRLEKEAKADHINEQLNQFEEKHFPENELGERTFKLQNVSEWHSNDRYGNYSYKTVSDASIISMSLVAVFLILTACVNFVNLKTALALRRTREIGIRKVLGSGKKQLVFQFLGETFLTVLVATLLSMGLSELMLLEMNEILETELHIRFTAEFTGFIILLMVIVTLAAGAYPAKVIAGYQPALAIKNVVSSSGKKEAFFRKSLVTFQFFISQFFIIGTIVLISQMNYVESLDLGFHTESIINVPVPRSENSTKKVLKNTLSGVPGVENVSLISSTPASGSVSITNYDIGTDQTDLLTAVKIADENYFELYNMELLAGQGLDASDTINRLVVNEKWALQSGFEDPGDALGTMVKIWGYNVPVTGVVKNFHTISARENIQPVVVMSGLGNARNASLKLVTSNLNETMGAVEKAWKQVYPEYTFEYEFLDEYIAGFYDSERTLSRIFSFFSGVAILIGMLGLFGLISFSTERRMKEIGVRKVMGASVMQIVLMFSWDVIKLILVSFLFAAPLAWYVMTQWLANYTFKVDISIFVFISGFALTALISLLTIGYRSLKVAYVNPANTLRSE